MKYLKVDDLFKVCSLLTEFNGRVRCGHIARAVVIMADDSQMWRCNEHKTIRRRTANGGHEVGPWSENVKVSNDYGVKS